MSNLKRRKQRIDSPPQKTTTTTTTTTTTENKTKSKVAGVTHYQRDFRLSDNYMTATTLH